MTFIFRIFLITLLSLIVASVSIHAQNGRIIPESLKCELREEPLGIDVPNPDLSYILKADKGDDRGLRQTAYQILVASSSATLAKDEGDLWNSAKVQSDKMAYISYAGKALKSSQKCWWKVRVWDNDGNISGWSSPATWTMGLLKEEDWKANWLTAAGAEKYALTPFGYKALPSEMQATTKWVQVDLGQEIAFSTIRLTPMFFEDRAGYGFPINFAVEVSNDKEFKQGITVADYKTTPFKNPGWKTVSFPVNKSARYVRVTAYKLWGRDKNFQFALRQLMILSNGKNIASGRQVEAFDSNETEGWTKQNLTDEPEDRSILPNYSSMILRKEFPVSKNLVRAVIHISGLSEYELTINGKKVGDYLLSPGWTDYKKTILYNTYDVTKQLQDGTNAVGIILGNGMYNIQPDSVRYVKFLNSFGPLKAIAQLQLDYADGTTKTIVTDKSWQVAPGPVTYSNMFGGEDYDANAETIGWNKPSFKVDSKWKSAVVTTGPGGTLKGLSCDAPPVKVIESKQPVKITKLKDNVWIYDYGQNASMMPYLVVNGPKNSYVRMIPSELLGQDGYVDRKSATQDGARPAWWQYTLTGNGEEEWRPKFFYQGARYLQVELFSADEGATLPVVITLQSQIVHSSSAPVGRFSSSNDLFNRIYELVRWAQRSNMVSLMTDCPHREKMGWLEENHLNGPSLRYNYDLSSLFRKTMNDMADAQLSNGLVPNIAPEYFIAGPPALTNGFRNSVEWGSSFIIIPWQQYLFAGDISLLRRYYDRMKKYVNFLASTTKNNIITTGLGDWYDIGPKPAWGSQLTPVSFTGTAVYYYDNIIMYNIAKLLGKEKDAEHFKNSSEQIRKAFNDEFYKPETGLYSTGSNTTCAMPLFFNLVEDKNREKLLAALVDSIRNRDNSFTSGEVGFRFLLRALSDGEHSDVVYDMNNQSEKPGYGYQLKMGATSLTEKWDAGVGDFGSQNHFMSGQINEWFFNDLVGIAPDESEPGFRKIKIKPAILPDLMWVKGSFTSVSGDIVSEWKKEDNRIKMNIVIPVNASAIVYVPSKNSNGNVTEMDRPVSDNQAVKFVKYQDGYSVYEIGSGSYHFSSTL